MHASRPPAGERMKGELTVLDLHTQALGLKPILWDALALPGTGSPGEPDTLRTHWYELMLDEIDYGVLLLGRDAVVLHMNHAARCELDAQHPLQLLGRQLRAADAEDAARLQQAVQAAQLRGLRRLLLLGPDGHRVAVSVVPLQAGPGGQVATQLSLAKRQVCGELGVQWFARSYGLTLAETRVLEALSEGLQPNDIATRFGVGISTIRSQIGSIRAKTRSDSIGALVRQVAVLPPLVGALRSLADGPAQPQAA
jgi:DNA-binding CsgD family transcriptional regulator